MGGGAGLEAGGVFQDFGEKKGGAVGSAMVVREGKELEGELGKAKVPFLEGGTANVLFEILGRHSFAGGAAPEARVDVERPGASGEEDSVCHANHQSDPGAAVEVRIAGAHAAFRTSGKGAHAGDPLAVASLCEELGILGILADVQAHEGLLVAAEADGEEGLDRVGRLETPGCNEGQGGRRGGAEEDLSAVEAIARALGRFLTWGKGSKIVFHSRVRNCRTVPRPPPLRGGRAAAGRGAANGGRAVAGSHGAGLWPGVAELGEPGEDGVVRLFWAMMARWTGRHASRIPAAWPGFCCEPTNRISTTS